MKIANRLLNCLLVLSVILWLFDIFYMSEHVTAISYDKTLGDKQSDTGYGLYYQYYNLDSLESRYKVRKELGGCLLDPATRFPEDGLLTARFLVHKDGKADRFRTDYLDENYRKIVGAEAFSGVKHVVSCLKKKKHWQTGRVNGKPRKYIQLLNFRIRGGRIEEIF
ncbi:hypothetical protein [Sphingobacterium deserti]|uniref:TonB C-terminal domain-containing protein n=1 Tax=Sphingobacterium deserti TaxID=1229276 RepID=A0A0B8T5Y0_9SPHI|nr:hypothetical protein [Sphingobacterium deserti]KGE13164.1 hypothetical protein DI53_3000 [Sphingobacterium deserti]